MRTLIAVLLALSLTFPVLAQTGTLSGSVVDPAGVPVDAATVRAKNTQSGAISTTTSLRDGKFSLSVPYGTYDVTAAGVPAMATAEQKGVTVTTPVALVSLTMDFNTQLGTIGEDRVSLVADAQRHNPPTGVTPRTKDGKPDLSGVWWRPTDVDGGGPQFLPAAEAVAKERRDRNNRDNPQVRCLPGSATRVGPLFELVQSQDYLVIINDDESPGFHQAYINGKHPDNPNPAWYGHNAARWDGDTLVVDRVAFDERIWLDQGGHPHSPQLHIVERYTRPTLGHLNIEVTVEDPGVLAKPYTIKRTADLAQGYDIYEFICAENERDAAHMNAK
jgi:hypothetical protein